MSGDNKGRPFKVRKGSRGVQMGLVAKNFTDLKRDGCKKLNMPLKELGSVTLTDDTVVDEEYFSTLPRNTVLCFRTEKDCGYQELLDKVEEVLDLNSSIEGPDLQEYIDKVHYEQDNVINILDYLRNVKSNPAENRHEDEAWFEGLPSKYKTKCQVLRDRAKARVQKYFNLTRTKLLPGDKTVSAEDDVDSTENTVDNKRAKDVLDNLRNRLKTNKYHQEYFDRSDTTEGRCCDETGKFECQGSYDRDACHARHTINPYLSRDTFIEFSSWNLDHQIEKSKEIIPRLKEAVFDNNPDRQVNWEYFYDLLFTMENLKLVHVSCHDKTDHKLTIDRSKMFVVR